jgi:hypothetical protein
MSNPCVHKQQVSVQQSQNGLGAPAEALEAGLGFTGAPFETAASWPPQGTGSHGPRGVSIASVSRRRGFADGDGNPQSTMLFCQIIVVLDECAEGTLVCGNAPGLSGWRLDIRGCSSFGTMISPTLMRCSIKLTWLWCGTRRSALRPAPAESRCGIWLPLATASRPTLVNCSHQRELMRPT